jgi:hypothetical protein
MRHLPQENPQTDMNDPASQLLSLAIARSWDEHIREFLVKRLGLPPSFDPRDHASFIQRHGSFTISPDGVRTFFWQSLPILRGEMVYSENRDSVRYVITKLKQ